MGTPEKPEGDARTAIAEVPLWYHTLELAPGVVTPGWFDLRPTVDLLPWPEVSGKRCLDVGTYDGFLAFELERRGAAEVVATDISSHQDWDWPPRRSQRGSELLEELAGGEKGRGFEVAKEALGSSVERTIVSVYDLEPEAIGTFDVVVCGSLLLHLRDPLRALAAIRSVCEGHFLSMEEIDLVLTLRHRRRPVPRLDGVSNLLHWFVPNAAAHRRMLEAAGFELVRWTKPYANRFGPGHPPPGRGPRTWATEAARRIFTGAAGVPHQAVLSRV